ncbi:MAG: hypothetical protein AAF658_06420 [Myxococcota bacterium]
MMVAVHYQFFLTDSGVEIFPDWVALAASAMGASEGFVGAELFDSVAGDESCHMMVRFREEEDAWKWAMSPEHIRVLERLDGHHTRPWRTATYRIQQIPHS